nr:OmpA family protein [Propionibacterium sp.]
MDSQQRAADPAEPDAPGPDDTEVGHYHRPLLSTPWIVGLVAVPALLAAIGLLGRPAATATPAGSATTPIVAASAGPAPSGSPSPGARVPILAVYQDGRAVTVAGSVPDAATRLAVVDALKKAYGSTATVADRLTVDPAAPAVDAAAFGALAAALKGVAGVAFEAQGGNVKVSGAALDEAGKAAALAAAAQAYPGGAVDSAGIVVGDPAQPPASCDAVANHVKVVTAATRINFGTGGSGLTADSRAALKRIADAVKPCTGLTLLVAGNTDNTGTDTTNQRLSEQRASAVKAALVQLGVPEGSITTVGNGSSQPLASNDTAAGRTTNRRVDITVQ